MSSLQLTSASGVDGLRYLEHLMDESGIRGASTANSSFVGSASSPTASSKAAGNVSNKPVASSAIRDCLEPKARGGGNANNQSKMDMSSVRRSPSPALLQKGARLLGKGEDDDSRYYGKDYGLGTRSESPGPIYDPPLSTFNPSSGTSFNKAPKRTMETMSVGSLNSELVSLPGSIGRQVESSFSNASKVAFTRANRFNTKQFVSRIHDTGRGMDSPAPTAYQPSVEGSSTNTGHGAVLCGGRVSTSRLFISRAHTADCIGIDSPGPIYNPLDGAKLNKDGLPHPFARATSNAETGPSISFTGSRSVSAMERLTNAADVPVTSPACRCHVGKDDVTGKWKRTCVQHGVKAGGISKYVPQEPFISHEHSKVQSTANTPGPAYYTPSAAHDALEKRPAVSFTKAKLSAGAEKMSSASPGPKYNPSDSYTKKNAASVTFGSRYPHEDRVERFNEKQFVGKAFAVGLGTHSPGPVYEIQHTAVEANTASASIVSKEKSHDTKLLFPGPMHNRFISKENAKENMGAYSPGPKYDTRGDISHEGVSFSIPQSAKLGQPRAKASGANNPAAGFDDDLDGTITRKTPVSNKRPAKETLLNPKDDYLSTTVKGPAISIAPNPTSMSRKRPESPPDGSATEDANEHAARVANFTQVETAYPAVSFSKNSRLPPTRQLVQPGPTQYTPNWTHVEKRVTGMSIGVL
jgi:hypothetical protein